VTQSTKGRRSTEISLPKEGHQNGQTASPPSAQQYKPFGCCGLSHLISYGWFSTGQAIVLLKAESDHYCLADGAVLLIQLQFCE
jgi:hypothetical protein